MSGTLSHSPARIIAELLVNLSVGTSVTDDDWAAFAGVMPDLPDSAIAVFNSESVLFGSSMIDGEVFTHHGVQIQIRDALHEDGFVRANLIATTLDAVDDNSVTVGASTYTIHAFARTGDVLHLGKEVEQSKRDLFSLNGIAEITKTS